MAVVYNVATCKKRGVPNTTIRPPNYTLQRTRRRPTLPEIERVEYDLWEPRVTVRFLPGEPPVYVTFPSPNGFRVLDEGNLFEFWTDTARSPGWVWEVPNGGWLDHESRRPGFVREIGNEYLVVGLNDCISVVIRLRSLLRHSADAERRRAPRTC